MVEGEEKNLTDDILEQIGTTSANLESAEAGKVSRRIESEIYKTQVQMIFDNDAEMFKRDLALQELDIKRSESEEKIAIERERLELERQIQETKLRMDESRAKNEKAALWTKVGLVGVEVTSGIWLGLLYLRANLKYGGFVGKDGKKIFDDIKKVRLW